MAVKINFPKRDIPNIPLISLANLALIMVIFMLFIVKFEKQAVKNIDLPISISSYEISGQKQTSTIIIKNNNEIYVEGFKINSLNELEAIYLPKAQRDITVLIKADKNVNVGLIADIMEKLKGYGINKIALITGG